MSRRFGRYVIKDEVTDELGRGAFGRVYRAFDQNINRYVAIKVLASASDPDLLSRFQDESKTAGQLEHENIVKVYDFDLQDGIPYLVMELLDGETLETVIKTQLVAGQPIRLLDKIEIMQQVAKGLQYAHSENVIHRDIKPGNIMVLPNGAVKVMDFGIARVVDKDGTRRTRQGDLAGTILYMAPEQFSGQDADRRTDIFAYADVYYELLTGEQPFVANDFATVMYRITTYDPRPIREKCPECPAALETIIHRLLAKDREIRPDRLEEIIPRTRLILQRLRRERAAAVAGDIQPLVEAGKTEQALVVIRRVLDLDPMNQVADRWREHLEHEAMRARAEALTRQGQEHAAARRFKEALQCFESALKLDQSNSEIGAAIEQIQAIIERFRNAGRLISEARAEMARGQLESALNKAVQAVELDPGNPDARPMRDDLRELIRSRREAAALAHAESLRGRSSYDAALAILTEAEADLPGSARISAFRARVERERAEAEIRRLKARLQTGLAKAREALYGQRLEEASDSAVALCAEYPEEPEAAELLLEVREYLAAQRRLEDINTITQNARSLIKGKRLEEAREVLETGLRSYPRDTGMTRLIDIVNTLAATQELARKIGQAVRQAHSLSEAGRLDEALRAIDAGIAELGKEPALVVCRRSIEFEREQREYALGLQAKLEQARRPLAEGNPAKAVQMLEDAALQYPGEPEVALLLTSARTALAAVRERESVSQTLSQMASFAAVENYGAALTVAEAALARYASNTDLQSAAEQSRQGLREQEHKRLLAAHIRRIEEAAQFEDWESAARNCDAAQREFPADASLAALSARIHEAQRQLQVKALQEEVRVSLARQDLAEAERQLTSTQAVYSEEASWQTLWREFERYRVYDRDIKLASEAHAAGDYARAEEALRPWFPDALDDRAAKLWEAVSRDRREAEEQARAEQARRQTEAAIAKGRSDAAGQLRKGDCEGAIAMLDALAGQFPDRPDIQSDRQAAARELDRQRREAEERARQQTEAAIAKGRSDAAEQVRKGDCEGAIAMLDALAGQFPDRPDIQSDRQAAAREFDRQQTEAIDKGRSDAAEQVRKGDCEGAIATLDALAGQFPDRPDIQSDRQAAARELDRQHREAEERAREQTEAAIAKGRSDAAEQVRKGDCEGAIATLDALAGQFPDRPDIQSDRQAAARELDRQRREAEERARQQTEAAIAKGRSDAMELLRKGDCEGAIATLDALAGQFPDRLDIQSDRQAAARELDSQREEAEIAMGRQEAARLIEVDSAAAIAVLERLAGQHPSNSDVVRELETARRELERRRQEAEEQQRRQDQAVVAQGRAEAAVLAENGEYPRAIAMLDRLASQYPDDAAIALDRAAAVSALERARAEAAIAKGRQEAAVLAEQGEYEGAIALLDRLSQTYQSDPGVERDREAVARRWEHLRREQAAIAKGRHDATVLLEKGNAEGAIRVLDWLAGQYPGHAEIQKDGEAAERELERQRREAEAFARRQREEAAIATARQDAAALLREGDHEGALAILEPLANLYPGHVEIRRDRDSVLRVRERQRVEAEEQARRQREEASIDKVLQDAAALVEKGDHQGAGALLDWLSSQFPGHAGVTREREALKRRLETQQREAEELARRQQEQLAIAKARQDAADCVQNGDYPGAVAILDRLASQFPADAGIQREWVAAMLAYEQQRRDAEERAKQALANWVKRKAGAADAKEEVVERAATQVPEADAEERAKQALARHSVMRKTQHGALSQTVPGGPGRNAGIQELTEKARSALTRFTASTATRSRDLMERVFQKKR